MPPALYKLRTTHHMGININSTTHTHNTQLTLSTHCIAAMAGTLFRLFVILLGLSHLLCLQAIPVTRTESLMQGPQVHVVLENTHKVTTERNWQWEEPSVAERMDLELHDYPPLAANGRHTPRAP